MTEQEPRADSEVRDNPAEKRFELLLGGAQAGVLEYDEREPDVWAYNHLEIDPAFEHQGLGAQLARHALDDARARGRQVLPYCPYVRIYIKRHPEYLDLVPADRRTEFGL